MKCRKCGNKIFEQDKFCGVCGTPIEIKKEWEPSTNTVEKDNQVSEQMVVKQEDEVIQETRGEDIPPQLPKKQESFSSSSKEVPAVTNKREGLSKKVIGAIVAGVIVILGITAFVFVNFNRHNTNVMNTKVNNLKNKESSAYTILSKDVPQFENTPIALHDKGYYVKVDGKYGYIDVNGKWIIDPQYEVLSIMENKDENDYSVCAFPMFKDSNARNITDPSGKRLDIQVKEQKEEGCANTGFGGTGPIYYYDDGEIDIYYSGINDEQEIDMPEKPKASVRLFENDENFSKKTDTFYIYNQGNDKVYGPYKTEDIPNFRLMPSALQKENKRSDIEYINLNFTNADVYGLFWVREDKYYRIVNTDGMESTDVYEQAIVISDDAILAKKGEQWGIVDKDLTFIDLKDTSIEEMTKPIEGKCYIKKNGKWMLVELSQSSKEKVKNEEVVYPDGEDFGGNFHTYIFYPNGTVIEEQGLPNNDEINLYKQYGHLEVLDIQEEYIEYKIVFDRAEEILKDNKTRSMDVKNYGVTLKYYISSNQVSYDDGPLRDLSNYQVDKKEDAKEIEYPNGNYWPSGYSNGKRGYMFDGKGGVVFQDGLSNGSNFYKCEGYLEMMGSSDNTITFKINYNNALEMENLSGEWNPSDSIMDNQEVIYDIDRNQIQIDEEIFQAE